MQPNTATVQHTAQRLETCPTEKLQYYYYLGKPMWTPTLSTGDPEIASALQAVVRQLGTARRAGNARSARAPTHASQRL